MDMLALLVGLPLDHCKSGSKADTLVILGARIAVCFQTRDVAFTVLEGKAAKWSLDLARILDLVICDPGLSGKLAGRLSFLVTLAADRIGRAYVKPFHAQCSAPLPGDTALPYLLRACQFFLSYLRAGYTTRLSSSVVRSHVN